MVIIPGFLGTDLYLMELHGWLGRIGYLRAFPDCINIDCPNLLIQRHLNRGDGTKDSSNWPQPGRSDCAQWLVKDHEILLGYYPGLSDSRRRNQQAVLHAAEAVRLRILQEHGRGVLPDCYTGRCTCNFVDSLKRNIPDAMMRTAIYTVMTASPRLNPPSEMRSRPPPALPR